MTIGSMDPQKTQKVLAESGICLNICDVSEKLHISYLEGFLKFFDPECDNSDFEDVFTFLYEILTSDAEMSGREAISVLCNAVDSLTEGGTL